MKKLISFGLTLLLLPGLTQPTSAEGSLTNAENAPVKIISLQIDAPFISINGDEQPIDDEGTVPFIKNGRTLVPLRSIFEALSVDISWNADTQRITGIQGNTEINLKIGDHTAYKNDRAIRLEAAPEIVNGRTMIPLRFVAESLGAEVEWLSETQTIIITHAAKFMALPNLTIYIGDTLSGVEEALGKADRIDPGNYDFDWYVYNSDYSRFIMVGIKNGFVEALYSNSAGFSTNYARYGDSSSKPHKGVTLYTDKYDNGKVHACLIISDEASPKEYDESLYRAQELQNFDATNAFRVNHGLDPLEYDDIAALTARKHSQDMADKNFFDHTNLEGLSPWDRYKNNGGKNSGSGENIAAGPLLGIDAFDGWVNSEGHRDNMLGPHKYLGVGYGYNPSSQYNYYMTQFFSS